MYVRRCRDRRTYDWEEEAPPGFWPEGIWGRWPSEGISGGC